MDVFLHDNSNADRAEPAALLWLVLPRVAASPSRPLNGEIATTHTPLRLPCPSCASWQPRWRCFRVLAAISNGSAAVSTSGAHLPDGWERIVLYVQDLRDTRNLTYGQGAAQLTRRLELLRRRIRPSQERDSDDPQGPDDPDNPPSAPAAGTASSALREGAPISWKARRLRRAA